MFKKLFLLFIVFSFLLITPADSVRWYTWRYRDHATDCTALTDGKAHDLCFEIDSENFYKCEPAAGDCDAAAEWKLITDPTAEADTLQSVTDRGATTTNAIEAPACNIPTKKITVTTFTCAGINAAIDALGAEGGEVYLPEGDYDCTEKSTIDYDNTTLRGAGAGTRILATNRFVYTTVSGTPAAGETLNGDTNGYTATVEQVDTTNKIVWYHTLSNAANYADGEVISWSGGADTTISGTPTEQNFDVIDVNGKNFITIGNLKIVGGSGGGNSGELIVSAGAVTNLLIENGYFYRGDDSFTQLGGANYYMTVRNNYIEEMDGNAIYSVGYHTFITDNTLINCIATGAIILGGDSPYSVIERNTLSGCGQTGITTNSDNATIAHNTIYANTRNAIHLNSSATYCNVIGNSILNTTSGFSDILNNGDYNIIIGNNCIGSGTSNRGIYFDEADYGEVSGNISTGHDVAGIQEDADCQNNLIYGNNIQDATPYALSGTAPEPNIFNSFLRTNTSDYRRYYHLPIASFDPGASGATYTDAGANNLGGWLISAVGHTLELGTDVHADWDGVTDLIVEIYFQVSDATTADTNTVDLVLVPYYMGVGDTATKTQTIAENVTITDGTQWKMYKAIFTIDEDYAGNNIDEGDRISFILHMETDTSEVNDIIVTNGSFYYQTTHVGIESGDI